MKNILVTSKRKFSNLVKTHQGEDWAYISIEGTPDLVKAGLIKDNLHYLPTGDNVLNLEFDDVEEDTEYENYRAYSITEEQAKEILEFARNHQDFNLLIHCYAGKSRSVAVAQGILDCFPGVWKLSEESNPLLTPNMKVLIYLHRYGLYS